MNELVTTSPKEAAKIPPKKYVVVLAHADDRNGRPLPKDHNFGEGEAYVRGTLFLQDPVLDKGPPNSDKEACIIALMDLLNKTHEKPLSKTKARIAINNAIKTGLAMGRSPSP